VASSAFWEIEMASNQDLKFLPQSKWEQQFHLQESHPIGIAILG
jgi:hypothetical protein